jgi:hypothetical protein
VYDNLSPTALRDARAAARLLYSHRRNLDINDIAARLDTLTADITAELENRENTARTRRTP